MGRVIEGVLKLLTKDFSNLNIASIIACFRLRVIKYAWGTLGCSSSKDDFWRLLRKPRLILAPTFFSLQCWPVSSMNLPMNLYFVDDKILIFYFQGQKIGLSDARWLLRTQQQFFAHLFFSVLSMNFLRGEIVTLLPLIFMIGVHPPSPHPKSPMWQKTEIGFESKCRVTSSLLFDLLNEILYKEWRYI